MVRQMPRLRGALQIAIDRQGGTLTIDEKVRDFGAEGRDEERYERELEEWNSETVTARKKMRKEGYREPEKPKKPMWMTVPKRVGTVPPMSLFSVDSSPKQYVIDIATQFENIDDPPVSRMSAADRDNMFAYRGKRDSQLGRRDSRLSLTVGSIGSNMSNDGMSNTLKQVGVLLERIEKQIDRLAELPAFFHPDVLRPLAEWATARELAGTYSAGMDSLTFASDEADALTVSMPRDYRVPSKMGLKIFREAINRAR